MVALIIYIPRLNETVCQCKCCCCVDPNDRHAVQPSSPQEPGPGGVDNAAGANQPEPNYIAANSSENGSQLKSSSQRQNNNNNNINSDDKLRTQRQAPQDNFSSNKTRDSNQVKLTNENSQDCDCDYCVQMRLKDAEDLKEVNIEPRCSHNHGNKATVNCCDLHQSGHLPPSNSPLQNSNCRRQDKEPVDNGSPPRVYMIKPKCGVIRQTASCKVQKTCR